MKLEIESLTDVGKRKENQDYLLIKEIAENYLLIVADGLGAHAHSELASRYFSEAADEYFNDYLPILKQDPAQGMQSLIRASAQSMSLRLSKEHHFDALTTCAVAFLNDSISVFAHLGDSRIYRIEDGNMTWRTIDHSRAQELLTLGRLSETQLNTHPSRNMLTKCIGLDDFAVADISIQDPLKANEAVLLCSDGFWESMTDDDLNTFFSSSDLQKSLSDYLKKLHKTVPALDNVTAIYARPI